jgi:hypothetical protein
MEKPMLVSTSNIRREVGHDYEMTEMPDSMRLATIIPKMQVSDGLLRSIRRRAQ